MEESGPGGTGGASPFDPPPGLSTTSYDEGFPGMVTVGDLLGTSARAIGANFVSFTIIGAVCLLPGMLMEIAYTEWSVRFVQDLAYDPYSYGSHSEFQLLNSVLSLGVQFVSFICRVVGQAGLVFGTLEFLAGRRPGVPEAMQKGLSKVLPVVGLSILYALGVGLGLVACIVPGVILACGWLAAVPAAVMEGQGPVSSLSRSWQLTEGHRGTIFLALLCIFLMEAVVGCAFAGVLGGGMFASGGLEEIATTSILPQGVRVFSYIGGFVINLFAMMISAAVASVFYARVRGIRDGVDVDSLTRVFA